MSQPLPDLTQSQIPPYNYEAIIFNVLMKAQKIIFFQKSVNPTFYQSKFRSRVS